MQVVDGIYQVQLPLPFPLRFVNCYLLRDGDGWVLVDTGLWYPPGQEVWRRAFMELGVDPMRITRIIVTHTHPDHYGMAGWLAALSGAPVCLSAVEQEFAQRIWHGDVSSYQAAVALFREHGMPADLSEVVYRDMVALRTMVHPLRVSQRLEPGDCLQIGGRCFRVLLMPGHSDGHVVLYCEQTRLLLCGDVVLAKITPNIGLWPFGRPDPLADFFQSLDLLSGLVVDVALPGHGPLIDAFSARVAALRAHHEERLLAAEQAVAGGETGYAVCLSIFQTADLSPHQIRFAMAETLAHLDYLVYVGRLVCVRSHGRLMYQRVSS